VARIADANTHRQRGLSAPAGFQAIKIAVLSKPSGRLSLKLTSHSPINEPIVNFLIQLHWPHGESIKEVAALLDPPHLAPSRAIAEKEPSQERKTLPTAAKPKDTSSVQRTDWVRGSKYGPVPSQETLMQVARNVRGDTPISLQSVMQRIFERNPNAFVSRDIHRLQAGAWLTIPDLHAAAPLSRAKKRVSAKTKPKAKPLPWASENRYGPIKPGESLWEIGQRLHGGTPDEIMDWMEAVAQRNEDAFIGRDSDRLMAGAVLLVPGAAPAPKKEETKTAEAAPAPVPERKADQPTVPSTEATPAKMETPVVEAPPTPEQKPEDAPKTAETTPPPSEPAKSATAGKPVLQVTGLGQDQENAVHIKDLEEQLAQERDLAKERDMRNQLLSERISVLESTIQELREKAASPVPAPTPVPVPAPVPTPSPVVDTPSPGETGTTAFPLENWWLGGLLAAVLGGALFWTVRNRSALPAPAEGGRHRTPDSSYAESKEAARDATATPASRFSEPVMETEFSEPQASELLLAAEPTFIIESPQQQSSSHISREAAAYLAYGDYDRAQTSIEAAIDQDPHNDEHKVMLLAIYSASGQHGKASVLSQQLLNQHPPISDEIRKQIEDIQSSAARNQRMNL
jgi:pilus assembly protein FimV